MTFQLPRSNLLKKNGRVYIGIIAVLAIIIICGGIVLLLPKLGVCGGKKTTTPSEPLRSLFYDEKAETLWMGAGSGNVYAMKGNEYEQCQSLGTVVNAIESLNDSVFFATDGQGVYQYTPETNEWKQYLAGMIDNRFYDLVVFQNELIASSWEGLTVFNGQSWHNFDLTTSEPIGPMNFHAVLFTPTKWYFGTISDGLDVYDPTTQEWQIYQGNQVYTRSKDNANIWTPELFGGYVPLSIRDVIVIDERVFIAADDPRYALTAIEWVNGELTTEQSGAIPTSRLTSLDFSEQILIVTDWKNGVYLFGDSKWFRAAPESAFDVLFVSPQLAYVASSAGLLKIDIPNNR